MNSFQRTLVRLGAGRSASPPLGAGKSVKPRAVCAGAPLGAGKSANPSEHAIDPVPLQTMRIFVLEEAGQDLAMTLLFS